VLFVEDAPPPPERVVATPRVNVKFAGDWAAKPWRWLLAGSRFVSGPVPEGARPPRRRG
jgi:DNA-3-methyladenine glycosylase